MSKPRPRFRLDGNPPESAVLSACMTYLATLENQGKVARVRRVNVVSAYRKDGTWAGWSVRRQDGKPDVGHPDIECVLAPSGRAMAVEVKRPGGRLGSDQIAWLKAFRAAGGHGVVVETLDELVLAVEVGRR